MTPNIKAQVAKAGVLKAEARLFTELQKPWRPNGLIFDKEQQDAWKADWIDGKITSIHKLGVDFMALSWYNTSVDKMFGGVLSA